MNIIDRKLVGNMLKNIITRIDYDDLYEVNTEMLKKIKSICFAEGLTTSFTRKLEEDEDFELNDPTTLRDLPIEYVRNCLCYSFFDENLDYIIEINQFFLRIIQKVDRNNYSSYEQSHLNRVNEILKILLNNDVYIRRIGVKKVDEDYFESLDSMSKVFKSQIIQQNIFGAKQNWSVPRAGSSMVQNFEYNGKSVNFFRKIDRVQKRIKREKVENLVFYKIYLEYDVYDRKVKNPIEDINVELIKINEVTKKLFLESFTEKGMEIITKQRRIGDYEFNE
ncbi:hypothetical protein [Clostridium tarantellae]|uniref:TIGR04255 family protein n=1 Tax=Clostridium tarantellae TaxID=39493 RepID=A0A6I1MGL3_9CLOT|nr:hypothetical protein [Clostridium tarantellae]MPQ42515.1 hypothetical protein [Clostridium tarantellae]